MYEIRLILVLRQQLFALLDLNSWWSTRQQLVALHDWQSVDARDTTTTQIITWHIENPQMELSKMPSCVEKPEKGFVTLQQAGKQLVEVRPTHGNSSLKREEMKYLNSKQTPGEILMMTHNKQARSKDLADGSNRQVTLASVWSMTAVVFKRGSSDDETRPTSLMDSLIFSVQSRSCSNGRWSCRTDASKADLIKEESWHQQPSIAHVASHYFGLDNLLLEGVASPRRWRWWL